MSSFKFDEGAFKREMEKMVQPALDDIARKMTRDLDGLRRRRTGHPVEEIKPELKRIWEKDGGKLTDPELTQYAQLIHDGQTINFKADKVRL